MGFFEVREHGPITELLMGPTLLGRPVFPFRAYLIDGLLIDTGPPIHRRDMARVLAERRISQVVNTHHHEDHAGNNDLLVGQGLLPLAHAAAVPLLESLPPVPLYRRLTWGRALDAPARALGEWVETPRYRFRVLHTPGHSPDHIALLEPSQGWLFSGDLYISDKLKLLRREEDPHAWMSSLDRAARADFGTLFCAHRGPVAEGPSALRRKQTYIAELEAGVRELHAKGLGEHEIARRLLGREDFLHYFSMGDFSRRHLISAFLPDRRSGGPEAS